jgi:hypothetical protein
VLRFTAKKHGRRGRRHWGEFLDRNDYFGLQRLVGSVRHGAVHAVR